MTVRLNIDKTAPEAYNQFDPITKTVRVFGRDLLSGVPPGPAGAVCIPAKWGGDDEDTGQNGQDHADNAQVCTYSITDAAFNKLVLTEKLKNPTGDDRNSLELRVRVMSVKYLNGPVMNAPYNQAAFRWTLNKDGGLKTLDQTMTVGKGKDRHEVDAKLNSTRRRTKQRFRSRAMDWKTKMAARTKMTRTREL